MSNSKVNKDVSGQLRCVNLNHNLHEVPFDYNNQNPSLFPFSHANLLFQTSCGLENLNNKGEMV